MKYEADPPVITTEDRELLVAVAQEYEQLPDGFFLTAHFDILTVMGIIGMLQLAQRHPQIPRSAAFSVNAFITTVKESFLQMDMPAHVKMIESGRIMREPAQETAPNA